MLKMSEESRRFINENIPDVLSAKTVNDALDLIYYFIDDYGFAPPDYEDYNEIGRKAQRVYDDIYMQN